MNKNLITAVLGFSLILLLLYLTFFKPCLNDNQYMIIRIVLSVSVAALAAVIPGFLNVRYSNTIKAGGALGVLVLTFFYTPSVIAHSNYCDDFVFTVSLHDTLGNVRTGSGGRLLTQVNGEAKIVTIDENGSATFKNISGGLRDSVISLQLQLEGWRFKNYSNLIKIRLHGVGISIPLVPDDSECCITGSVKDATGYLAGVKLSIGDKVFYTNADGRFNINIPPSERRPEYKLIVHHPPYVWENTVHPRTHDEVEIKLQ
ncbi:hypothetical protein [Mucilaginibacter flavidus]|uniref:hypothetical protein n=1 Tax=Mucilaginibacter flavidus TaxID=2949309 RepID=UPI002093C5B6|nr:hypothetical protein [Mucilaginibacter flavidus]MCO5948091.1 hypothetical protein [Mucilaginibacter flavidus]